MELCAAVVGVTKSFPSISYLNIFKDVFHVRFQQCRKPAIFRWFYTSHQNDKSLGVDPQVLCCAGWSSKATPSVPKWVCPLDLP